MSWVTVPSFFLITQRGEAAMSWITVPLPAAVSWPVTSTVVSEQVVWLSNLKNWRVRTTSISSLAFHFSIKRNKIYDFRAQFYTFSSNWSPFRVRASEYKLISKRNFCEMLFRLCVSQKFSAAIAFEVRAKHSTRISKLTCRSWVSVPVVTQEIENRDAKWNGDLVFLLDLSIIAYVVKVRTHQSVCIAETFAS